MRIHVGIVGEKTEGWQMLLTQEGIPHSIATKELSLRRYSAIVVSDPLDPNRIENLRKYCSGGGAILCSGETYCALASSTGRKVYVKYLLADAGGPFSGIGLLDLYTLSVLPPDANAVKNDRGRFSVFTGELRGGKVVALPFDAGAIVSDRRTATKSFYARRRRLPFEHVSLISNGGVRRLISRALEFLHHQRGISYVHTWYFPSDAQSVFAWRVDTDYASQAELQRLSNLLRSHKIPTTWFVDVKSQQAFLSMFDKMHDDEIGVHCFEHRVFSDYDGYLNNIQRALEVLREQGLDAKSYAGPYGCWNETIARAIDTSGFEYSSEFYYDYDSLPSFPVVGDNRTVTLQVPIHPVSIGSLRRQGFDESEMKDYFANVLEAKLHSREPMVMYHHPKDGNEQVLEAIFDGVHRQNISTLLMREYAAWWKRRIATTVELEIGESMLNVAGRDHDDNVWLHITRVDGSEAFSPIRSQIDFQKLNWKSVPEPLKLPEDIHRIRKFNPWIPIIRVEDRLSKLFHRAP